MKISFLFIVAHDNHLRKQTRINDFFSHGIFHQNVHVEHSWKYGQDRITKKNQRKTFFSYELDYCTGNERKKKQINLLAKY